MKTFLVVFEKGQGNWSAYVPDLPGCVGASESREELEQLMNEAVLLHIEDLTARGLPIPEPSSEPGKVVVAA